MSGEQSESGAEFGLRRKKQDLFQTVTETIGQQLPLQKPLDQPTETVVASVNLFHAIAAVDGLEEAGDKGYVRLATLGAVGRGDIAMFGKFDAAESGFARFSFLATDRFHGIMMGGLIPARPEGFSYQLELDEPTGQITIEGVDLEIQPLEPDTTRQTIKELEQIAVSLRGFWLEDLS